TPRGDGYQGGVWPDEPGTSVGVGTRGGRANVWGPDACPVCWIPQPEQAPGPYTRFKSPQSQVMKRLTIGIAVFNPHEAGALAYYLVNFGIAHLAGVAVQS